MPLISPYAMIVFFCYLQVNTIYDDDRPYLRYVQYNK